MTFQSARQGNQFQIMDATVSVFNLRNLLIVSNPDGVHHSVRGSCQPSAQAVLRQPKRQTTLTNTGTD